tara:strand:+ start:3649 stop:4380 length:732 start_codon:yes stop_codon:yes gene_type:complete
MSKVRVKQIEPLTGTNINLGAAGDSVLVQSTALKTNTYQDSGGNVIFTSDGAGNVSSVNAALAGAGPTFIQKQTASSSSSINFETGIDSTYDEYLFVWADVVLGTDTAYLRFTPSTASGSYGDEDGLATFYNAYSYYSWSTSSALAYDTSRDFNGTGSVLLSGHMDNAATSGAGGWMKFYRPSSTTYVKNFIAEMTTPYYLPTSSVNYFIAGFFNTTAAITKLQFNTDSGSITSGTFWLYGIK